MKKPLCMTQFKTNFVRSSPNAQSANAAKNYKRKR